MTAGTLAAGIRALSALQRYERRINPTNDTKASADSYEEESDKALAEVESADNNHSVRLGAYDLGGVGVLRFSGLSPSPELYELGPGSTAHTMTSDTSGQFRLVRTGSTLSGFFRTGTGWTFLGSETVSIVPTRFNLDLGTNGSFAPGGILVAFDNFKVNVGTISCPGIP